MSPIRGRECGTKTRSKQTGSFDWAKGVENPPRQRHQSGVGSWPRAAASAAAAGIIHLIVDQNKILFIFFLAFPIPNPEGN
jgi:hypothetical protein